MKPTGRLAVLLAIVFICAAATAIVAPRPIPQDQRYHQFADTRTFLGIPNFANVASSLIFIVAGLTALWGAGPLAGEHYTLSIGAVLTGVGSAVYHWAPSDRTLVFDRVGIVVVISAFLAALMDQFDIAGARAALPIFLVAGIGTILWWIYRGDLRPYGILQGLPLILLAVGSLLFPRRYPRHSMLVLAAIGYLLAKVFEVLDREIYALGGIVSGHTLKHLVAGAALWITMLWLIVILSRADGEGSRDAQSRLS